MMELAGSDTSWAIPPRAAIGPLFSHVVVDCPFSQSFDIPFIDPSLIRNCVLDMRCPFFFLMDMKKNKDMCHLSFKCSLRHQDQIEKAVRDYVRVILSSFANTTLY